MSVADGTDEVLHLAEGFDELGEDAWLALAVKVLNKGRAEDALLDGEQVRDRLRTKLPGGLVTEPLYLAPEGGDRPGYPGAMPFTRGAAPRSQDFPWDVRQVIEESDPKRAAADAAVELERGVTSLWFRIDPDALAAADLRAALAGVRLDLAPVAVSSWTDSRAAAAALAEAWRSGAVDPAEAHGSLGLDPLAEAAVAGAPADLSWLADQARGYAAEFPIARVISVDARPYHDAGGSEVDELGCAIATGVAYLRALEQGGIDPATAFGLIEFRLTATADQFLTTATFRALRRLWARVGEASGVAEADRGAWAHAVTSWRMMTRDDPWVNMLRGTLAAFGASAGGAQAMTTLPFDAACGLPDALGRRVARNTQILLAEESHVAAVNDPAGGSWYVEDLTEQLAQAAWAWFQEIERAGGMAAALADGLVAERLASSRAELDAQLARRRRPLTGVSMFPMVGEAPLERRPYPAPPPGGGLPRRRDSELFEALRDRARVLAEQGRPPTVFLATLGPQREFGPRQTFAANLFAVAGIATVPATATELEALAAEAAATSSVAVLCSSPGGYADHAAAAIDALRAVGVAHLVVAGRTTELGEAADRVDGAIADGMDVVAYLSELLSRLEAAQ